MPTTPWPVEAVRAALGLDGPGALTPLAAGAYHEHVVLDDRWVLRRCTGSQWGLAPREQLAREHATLEALAPTGLAPAPGPLVGDVLVEERVRGRPFHPARDLPALGRALRDVHALAPAHLPALDARAALLEDARAWLARAPAGAARDLLRELEARVAAAPSPPAPARLVHTDLNAGNLLVDAEGRVRLLDWEAARRADPAWDLAHAVSPTTTLWDPATACEPDARQVEAFLRAYGDDAIAGRVGALLDAVVLRALAWCLGFDGAAPGTALHDALSRYRDPAFVERRLGDPARLGLR